MLTTSGNTAEESLVILTEGRKKRTDSLLATSYSPRGLRPKYHRLNRA